MRGGLARLLKNEKLLIFVTFISSGNPAEKVPFQEREEERA